MKVIWFDILADHITSVSPCCTLYYTVSQKKLRQCYFLNNSVKHWPTLIIFGVQHRKGTRHKWPQFGPSHLNIVAALPCEMQKS